MFRHCSISWVSLFKVLKRTENICIDLFLYSHDRLDNKMYIKWTVLSKVSLDIAYQSSQLNKMRSFVCDMIVCTNNEDYIGLCTVSDVQNYFENLRYINQCVCLFM